jgi:hypothetical protein
MPLAVAMLFCKRDHPHVKELNSWLLYCEVSYIQGVTDANVEFYLGDTFAIICNVRETSSRLNIFSQYNDQKKTKE